MVTISVATPYHQQDTNYYCGAASAQMVLASISGGKLLDQTLLYKENHSHSTAESGWATGPDGLTWTLNHHQPAHYLFVLDALASEDSISRMICWTLHHYKVAPVALVYGSQHWVVVRGAHVSAVPASSQDHAYSISGFHVNNPWPPVPGGPGSPPPHSTTDHCGSGGNRGIANEHISYAAWRSTYMTGVPSGHWAGKFVAVCDPSPPPTEIGRREAISWGGPGPLIAPQAALAKAQEGVTAFRLVEDPDWARALQPLAGAAAAEPVLVQRLDHPDSYYYLVPQGGAVVAIDAHDGSYLQSSIHPEAPRLLSPANLTALGQLPFRQQIHLPNQAGLLQLRPEAATPHKCLVWKPCAESLSPVFPFQLVSQGEHQVYVRVDGAVFSELHTEGRGL